MIEYKPRKKEKPKIENEKVSQAWDYIQRVGSPYDFCYLDQFLENHTPEGEYLVQELQKYGCVIEVADEVGRKTIHLS